MDRPALLLAVAVPSLQWLLHFHDPARGLQRVRAFALERPERTGDERARLWDAMAYRAFRLRQWDWAVETSARSVRYAPHPRSIIMLAIARTYTGDHRGAESLYVALAGRTPDDPLVWVGLGGAALRVGDRLQISRALARLDSYGERSREARLIRRHLRYFPEVWPTEADAQGGRGGRMPPYQKAPRGPPPHPRPSSRASPASPRTPGPGPLPLCYSRFLRSIGPGFRPTPPVTPRRAPRIRAGRPSGRRGRREAW